MNPYQFVKMVDDGNEKFVRGDSKLLVNKEEIYQNINLKMGLPLLPDERERHLGIRYARIPVLFWLACASFVSYIVVSAFRNDWITDKTPLTHIVLLLLVVGMVFVCFKSLQILWRVTVYLKPARPDETEKWFDALTRNGLITTGELVEFESTGSSIYKLAYRFVNNQGETIQGKHQADFSQGRYKTFVPRDKVAVLYLDDRLHILL